MGRKIVITEEQYVLPNNTPKPVIDSQEKSNGTEEGIKAAANKAINAAGADPKKVDVNQKVGNNLKVRVSGNDVSNNSSSTTVYEGNFMTKEQMLENRLRKMKENSELCTVSEFLERLK